MSGKNLNNKVALLVHCVLVELGMAVLVMISVWKTANIKTMNTALLVYNIVAVAVGLVLLWRVSAAAQTMKSATLEAQETRGILYPYVMQSVLAAAFLAILRVVYIVAYTYTITDDIKPGDDTGLYETFVALGTIRVVAFLLAVRDAVSVISSYWLVR